MRREGVQSDGHDPKKHIISCLNFLSKDMQHIKGEKDIKNKCIDAGALFVVTGEGMATSTRSEIKQQQHNSMRYFIDVVGRDISTNSPMVMATLMSKGFIKSVRMDKNKFPIGQVHKGIPTSAIDEVVGSAMTKQADIDSKQLFLCEVSDPQVNAEDAEEAKESAQKCHEPDAADELVWAWDDVNNCKLDPAKVLEARRAEMDYFRNMKVYKTCHDTKMQGPHRQASH